MCQPLLGLDKLPQSQQKKRLSEHFYLTTLEWSGVVVRQLLKLLKLLFPHCY